MPVLTAIVWIICGVLAYGLEKNWCLQLELRLIKLFGFSVPYSKRDVIDREIHCIFTGLLGPVGLACSLLSNLLSRRKIGLTYRMPKKLYQRS